MVQKGADSNQKHTDLMYEKFMNETIKLFNEERQKIKTWQDFVALNNAPPLIGGGTEAKRNQELEKIYKVLPLPIPIEFMETGDVKGFIEHLKTTQTGGLELAPMQGPAGALSIPTSTGGLSLAEYPMFGTGMAYLKNITPPGKRDEEAENNVDFVKRLRDYLKPKLAPADHDTQHWMGNFITMLGLYNSISKSKKEKYGPEFAKEWIKDGLKHHDRFHSEYLSMHAPEFADEWIRRFEPENSEDELEEISVGGAIGSVSDGSIEGYSLPLGAKTKKAQEKEEKEFTRRR